MSESFNIPGTHPDTGLYHVEHMPKSEDPTILAVREKQIAGEQLTLAEQMHAGRDTVTTEIGDYQTKPDHAYRRVSPDALAAYEEAGSVMGFGEDDEFMEGNNAGVDWYLGGVAIRYGSVILETPATADLFEPAANWGHNMAKDPNVRHMKSSGHANPVPMSKVNVIKRSES